jgi:PBSX family phage terminase large subunit
VTTPLDLSPALSAKQVLSVAQATARVNLWTGSVRSGKTVASLLRWMIYVGGAPYGGELVVVGRTRESIARNVFGPLQDPALFGPLAKYVSYTAGAPTGKILGRVVHVLGASDARAEMVLRGLTCAGAYVDEATLVSETFWQQLLARHSVPGSQIFATTNPDGPAHWLKRNVVDRAVELGYRVFQFKLSDNTHLDPAYVAQISREYVGLWYRRFILGEWVMAEGAVYDMWDPALHVVSAATIPPLEAVLSLGVDVGTTNPTRGVMLGLGVDRRLYAVAEWVPRKMTHGQLSGHMRHWLRTYAVPPRWVHVDPAAADFKLQLFNDGMSNVADGHNEVVPGIRTVSTLLATQQLAISDACPTLIGEFGGYSWNPKATEKGKDEPIKVADHSLDALRYAVQSTRFMWARRIRQPPADLEVAA